MELIQEVYLWKLEVDNARGRLILYLIMLKMKLESEDSSHADGGAIS
jgi:hypothetical protein